jgi:predicted dehydrogenase
MAGGYGGRRRFLTQAAGTSALLLSSSGLGLGQLIDDTPAIPGPPIGLGIVGAGAWGREILSTLARLPAARVLAVCDTYAPALKKAGEIAPGARAVAEVKALLEVPELEAVLVATPSHRHLDVVRLALDSGRHVYCEAPLASTVEEARTIADMATKAGKVFQGGLQGRANALHRHVAQFVKSGVLGTPVAVSAHWAHKDSWRRAAPTPAREAELNWRLSSASSGGLTAEAAIHQIDLVNEYLGGLPSAVSSFSATTLWKDGRDVADTVHCVFDYPRSVRVIVEATLASSAGGTYTLFRGTNASLMVRETRAWLIKEADSPLLGWEVYARKENVLEETGIALVADSTKILAAGQEPAKASGEPAKPPLMIAFERFLSAIRTKEKPACGPREAFQATALALQADAAARAGQRLALGPELSSC